MGGDGVRSVQLRDLQVSEEVGDGGEGTVYAVRQDDPEDRPAVVLNRYQRPLDEVRATHLRHLVGLRAQMRLGMGVYAWPEVLVDDGPRTVGVLMPRAPAAFWTTVTLRSGATRQRLREAQYLLFPAAKLQALGIGFAALAARLEVLAALTVALQHLHHVGLVYGDLSARNVLFATGSPVGVFLLDCDGIAVAGSAYVVDSPDWDDPSAPETATMAADVYKLGLFAARMLAVNPTVRQAPDGGRTPATLLPVLQAALSPEPAARPTVDELAAAVLRLAPGPAAGPAGELPTWGLRPGSGELVLVPPVERPTPPTPTGRRRRLGRGR